MHPIRIQMGPGKEFFEEPNEIYISFPLLIQRCATCQDNTMNNQNTTEEVTASLRLELNQSGWTTNELPASFSLIVQRNQYRGLKNGPY